MYRKTLLGSLFLVLLLAVLGFALPPCDPPTIQAEVVRVIDGDTIEIKIVSMTKPVEGLTTGANYRVRYIGVDAPERDEAGFDAATTINKLLVEGRTVYLELDQTKWDNYGRLLAYVYLDKEGHFMVNLALVTSTLFRVYPFENTPRYNECLAQADITPGLCALCGGERCVSAEEASRYYGQEIWVCGVVADVRRLDYGRIFINFVRPYPNHVFTIMVEEDYTPSFDRQFGRYWENKLVGKIVCVYGLVREYRGKPEILATDPSQLRSAVLGVPCPAICPCR